MLFPPFEPDRDEPKRRRFRPIPVRTLVPNLITLLALCAGLTAVLLPIDVYFLGAPEWAPLTFLYTLMIAFLMVSRLPVFSGKRLGTRVPREMVLPVFVVVVLFVALLLSYPWIVLSLGTLVYLGCLPAGYLSYRRFERSAAQAANATLGAEGDAASARSKSAAPDDR